MLPWLNAVRERGPSVPNYETGRKSTKKNLVAETLELVGIQEQDFRKLPKQLSGGMKNACLNRKGIGSPSEDSAAR